MSRSGSVTVTVTVAVVVAATMIVTVTVIAAMCWFSWYKLAVTYLTVLV